MKHIHHSDPSEYWHQSQRENSANEHPAATAQHSDRAGTQAKPVSDEVATKAYEIYLKEGRPQGREMQHWLQAETQLSVKK